MAKTISKEDRMWGAFCHLGGFGLFVAPLILWMIKREDSDYIDRPGKEAINFQISTSIPLVALLLLVFLWKGFLIPLIPVVLYDLVMIAMASVRAHEGEDFSYPLAFRFIRHEGALATAASKPAAEKKAAEEPKPAAKKTAKKKASKKKASKKKAAKKKSRR